MHQTSRWSLATEKFRARCWPSQEGNGFRTSFSSLVFLAVKMNHLMSGWLTSRVGGGGAGVNRKKKPPPSLFRRRGVANQVDFLVLDVLLWIEVLYWKEKIRIFSPSRGSWYSHGATTIAFFLFSAICPTGSRGHRQRWTSSARTTVSSTGLLINPLWTVFLFHFFLCWNEVTICFFLAFTVSATADPSVLAPCQPLSLQDNFSPGTRRAPRRTRTSTRLVPSWSGFFLRPTSDHLAPEVGGGDAGRFSLWPG